MVDTAREAGLGVTIHVGEEGGQTGRDEIAEVVEHLRPDRIGHGILAADDETLMAQLRDGGIVLEICPTSNLLTKALTDEDAVRKTFQHVRRARRRLHHRHGRAGDDADPPPRRARAPRADRGTDEEQLREANARGHAASFVGRSASVAPVS